MKIILASTVASALLFTLVTIGAQPPQLEPTLGGAGAPLLLKRSVVTATAL